MSAASPPAGTDLGDPSILQDPYPHYREAFAARAVCSTKVPGRTTFFVGRHAEVSALLRDARLSSDRLAYFATRLTAPQRAAIDPLLSSLRRWILFADAPAHAPMRRIVNAALSRKLVLARQPEIEALVSRLLDAVAPAGRLDVVTDLAYPLPAIVIAELLGARPDDRDQLRAWSRDIARFLGTSPGVPEVLAAQRSVVGMTEYFRAIVAQHRAAPRDDLLGALMEIQASTPDFDDEALLANCVAMVFAGHETTTNLIGNAVHLLLDRPELARRLRSEPEAWGPAIEEVLRFESPVQRVSRTTLEPLEVDGLPIPAGARLVLVLGAANRDPAVFARPDELDIDRDGSRHLGFGFGPHLCSGAALARLEARAALQGLVERFDGLVREQPPAWAPNFGLRSLESLPVRVGPR